MHYLLSPLTLGCVLFVVAALVWPRLARGVRKAVVAFAVVLMVAASPMGANALVWVQEHRALVACSTSEAEPRAIVALAGGMVARPRDLHDFAALGATSVRRLFGALALHKEHPDAALVFVGISRWDFPESEIMANLANPEHRYPLACRDDRERIGVRLIDGPLAGASCPIFQTSANRSGEPPPTSFDELDPAVLEGVELAIDGGELTGMPSTVVDLTEIESGGPWRVLREGAVPTAELERSLGGG